MPLSLPFSRRGFMQGATALGAGLALPRLARASDPALRVISRQIEVMGRAANVYGITGPDGRAGIFADEGARFSGEIVNETDRGLALHWHGQILAPPEADRARPGGGELAPGAAEFVDFALTPGTHWMHSHSLSEQLLLAAPMITREAGAPAMAEAVIMLHDFSFTSPEEILAGLGGEGMAHGMGSGEGGGMAMDHSAMGGSGGDMNMSNMSSMATHANDIAYDAFLANDRTLEDPEVITVEAGQPLRLRIINGGTASAFWIRTGALEAEVIAVDGTPCTALRGRDFPLAQGQRIDLVVTLPAEGGVFPVLAHLEDSRRRTGVILATAGADVVRLSSEAEDKAPVVDLSLDLALSAVSPLAEAPVVQGYHLMLGEAPGYRWTINGAVQGEAPPLTAAAGGRVELMFMNQSTMMHPMHLHGHHFQVVDVNGKRVSGPMRDTVIVPAMAMVTVAFDAMPGQWLLHCHHLYHMAGGMMTELHVA